MQKLKSIVFFKIFEIYLMVVTEKDGQTDRRTHTHTEGCNSILVSHTKKSSSAWFIFWWFPRYICRDLDQKWNSREVSNAPMGYWHHRQWLNPLCHDTNIPYSFLIIHIFFQALKTLWVNSFIILCWKIFYYIFHKLSEVSLYTDWKFTMVS